LSPTSATAAGPSMRTMGSILVTGASGFLGSNLVQSLVADGQVVYALARREARLPPGVRRIDADLADPAFPILLPPRIDAVVHLAQSRHFRRFPEQAPDIFAVNVQATALLADYARRAGAQHLIFASSGGVYGHSEDRLVETAPISPLNYYLASKYAAEILLTAYHQHFRCVILRPFFLYGPGQQGMLVGGLLARIRARDPITIDGDPGMRTNPLFVDDAVQALRAALGLERSAVINLCGDEAVTIKELVNLLGELSGTAPLVTHDLTRPSRDLLGDNSGMKELLGLGGTTTLRDGLLRTVGTGP
jgi:UDP-glucose 4-epimerase